MNKLIYFIAAFVLTAFIGSDVFAAAPQTWWTLSGYESVIGYKRTKQLACEAAATWGNGKTYSGDYRYTGAFVYSDSSCQLETKNSQGTVLQSNNFYVSAPRCYDGTVPSGGNCPEEPPPPPTCKAGQAGEGDYFVGSSKNPNADDVDAGTNPYGNGFPGSDGQCDIVIDEVVKCYTTPNATGGVDFYCRYGYHQNGTQSPSGKPGPKAPPSVQKGPKNMPPSKDQTPNDSCPKGTVNMGTDSSGIPICGGNGTKPDSPPTPPKTEKTTNTTNADGSTTKTTTTTQTNADGSTTTKTVTETTKPDGSKTTDVKETTGKAADGKDGKKDDSPEDKKDDFCKKNPQLNMCKNSSVSGSCENVSCEGDAIQCAIYRQQQKEYCEAKKDSSMRTLGDQLMAGNDPMKADLPTPKNGATFALGSFDSSGFLGGGACLQDISLSNGISLPVSKICEHILPLRFAIMTIAGLVAFAMLRSHVFKG